MPRPPPPKRSRWTSFIAPLGPEPARSLHQHGNAAHRVRVEHNRGTILIYPSDEDGRGRTVLAVDRTTRQRAVAAHRRQLAATADALAQLYHKRG